MSNGTSRRIVCDTGPLISLEKLTGGYRFIRLLFDQLIVPSAVIDELVVGQFERTEAYLRYFDAEGLLVVKQPGGVLEAGTQELDEGERQAIQLALELELPLLIEEEAGRRVARELGLAISGIAGQLLKAVREGVIAPNDAVDKLTQLRQSGRVNQQLFEAIYKAIQTQT